MKFIKIVSLVFTICIAGTSFAKVEETPIVFTKGSSCGYFDGNLLGRNFTLQLSKGQILYINMDGSQPILPKVTNPQGKLLPLHHEYPNGIFAYRTTSKGKYSVQFDIENEQYPFAEIKFCAR